MERHPLESFQYCPRCGKRTFVERGSRAKNCTECGLIYYANVAAAVAGIIKDKNGNLLTVRRGREPAIGTLDLPGGFLEPEETAEEGLKREILEETGLQIDNIVYLFSQPNIYPYGGNTVYTTDLFFTTECKDLSQAKAADDAAEIVILKPNEIDPALFGLRSIRNAIKKIFNHNSQ